jgi:hypothetical protein
VNSAQVLDELPETYQFVETGIGGFVLYGEPVLDRFPTTFDPRFSRQAFLLNLFKPLQYAFLEANPEGAAQAAARLILDIPTLAASERGECIPGHRARADWFLSERPAPLGLDEEIRSAVSAAKLAREEPPGSVALLAPQLHAAIPRAVNLLDPTIGPSLRSDSGIDERLAAWLSPRTPRRLLAECASVFKRTTNPLTDLRWLLRRKEASGGAALLGLLNYVSEGAIGTPAKEIRTQLRDFSRRECASVEGLAFVRSACEVYREGLFDFYPALRETD